MGSNRIVKVENRKLTPLISTAQNFTASWVDLGEEIDVRGKDSLIVYAQLVVGTSTNMRIRAITKPVSAFQKAVDMANEVKSILNAHLSNAAEHPVIDPNKSSKLNARIDEVSSLYDLVKELLDVYAAHNVDSALAVPAYHAAQIGAIALASVVKPVSVELALTRLADLKAKLITHSDDATAHTVGTAVSYAVLTDLEYSTLILQVGASAVQFESEYFEANVDANQNIVLQIPVDQALNYIQLQIQDAAAGTGNVASLLLSSVE